MPLTRNLEEIDFVLEKLRDQLPGVPIPQAIDRIAAVLPEREAQLLELRDLVELLIAEEPDAILIDVEDGVEVERDNPAYLFWRHRHEQSLTRLAQHETNLRRDRARLTQLRELGDKIQMWQAHRRRVLREG